MYYVKHCDTNTSLFYSTKFWARCFHCENALYITTKPTNSLNLAFSSALLTFVANRAANVCGPVARPVSMKWCPGSMSAVHRNMPNRSGQLMKSSSFSWWTTSSGERTGTQRSTRLSWRPQRGLHPATILSPSSEPFLSKVKTFGQFVTKPIHYVGKFTNIETSRFKSSTTMCYDRRCTMAYRWREVRPKKFSAIMLA